MSVTVYVPQDSGALSMGANAVAAAIEKEATARGVQIQMIRNGSRGMYWLEPLVEVATPKGRVAYGPVSSRQVASLFDAGFLQGGTHNLSLGLTEEIPYFKNQERLTFCSGGPDRSGFIGRLCVARRVSRSCERPEDDGRADHH